MFPASLSIVSPYVNQALTGYPISEKAQFCLLVKSFINYSCQFAWLIILDFSVNVHSDLTVFMTRKILNCLWIYLGIN